MGFGTGFTAALSLEQSVEGFFPSVQRERIYGANAVWPNLLLSPDEWIDAYFRGVISIEYLRDTLKMHGLSPSATDILVANKQSHFSALDAINMYRRGIIDYDKYTRILKRSGWAIDDFNDLVKLTQYMPSPQDLITFAVRDVYTPETIEEYELYKDIPQKYLDEASKVGLTEDFAKKYWGIHWQLPARTQVEEMLHRKVLKPDGTPFTPEDFATFLRVNDVSPYWRNMLEQISYRPLTRTDVRRMFELNVMDKAAVTKAFEDEGYSPENAKLMTDFTIVHDSPETTGLTRSNLMNEFVRGSISLDELEEMFREIGIIGRAAEYWKLIAQYNKAEYETQKIIDRYTQAYLTGSTDLDTIRAKLNQNDLPPAYVDKILADLLERKIAERKVPAVDTLLRWLENGVIDNKGFHGRMRLLGYNDEDILNYLTEVTVKTGGVRKVYLKKEDYISFFTSGIMNEYDLRNVLHDMGISNTDIDFLIVSARSKANESNQTNS